MREHEEILRVALDSLLEESRFESLSPREQAGVEVISEEFDQRGQVTPRQYTFVMRVFRGSPTRIIKPRGRPCKVNPETIQRLEEKFHRIARERGRLPLVTYRLAKRDRSNLEPIPPDVWARILNRYHRYLEDAKRKGKDVSTNGKRQPYLMIAMRWERSDREKRLKVFRKIKKTMGQKAYYYGVRKAQDINRLRGVANG